MCLIWGCQVERLVAHRAQMKAEKVGIYQPLMWQEDQLCVGKQG